MLEAARELRSETVEHRRLVHDCAERSFGMPSAPTVSIGAASAEWTRPRTGPEPVVLYLHGGSYCMGSIRSHRHLAGALADDADAATLLLDYRRGPEHPHPTAVQDAVAACRWLLKAGVEPDRLILAGESAGAGLALAAALALRNAQEPGPAALVCRSPWVDLSCSLASHRGYTAQEPNCAGSMFTEPR